MHTYERLQNHQLTAVDLPEPRRRPGQRPEQGHKLHTTHALGSEWIPSMKETMLQAVGSTLMVEGKANWPLSCWGKLYKDIRKLLHREWE